MAKLQSNLLRIALEAPKAAEKALRQTANDIVQVAKQLAPVDTGALQRSYRVEPADDSTMIVGTEIEYAKSVEFGSSRGAPAQPHFTPAFHQAEETFKVRLKEAVLEAK
jgi:HK97 gp10 family phage protein